MVCIFTTFCEFTFFLKFTFGNLFLSHRGFWFGALRNRNTMHKKPTTTKGDGYTLARKTKKQAMGKRREEGARNKGGLGKGLWNGN